MFLVIYNRRIVQEDLPPAEMLQLSRNLIAMWDVLNRGIGNYGLYVDMMVSIRDRYFVPVTKELGYCPDLWQETWDTHQDEAVESVGEREEEKREA